MCYEEFNGKAFWTEEIRRLARRLKGLFFSSPVLIILSFLLYLCIYFFLKKSRNRQVFETKSVSKPRGCFRCSRIGIRYGLGDGGGIHGNESINHQFKPPNPAGLGVSRDAIMHLKHGGRVPSRL
jgi:hypothetical protein